jgi:predicted flap endonuclease-1-like 5' DNA nuclease
MVSLIGRASLPRQEVCRIVIIFSLIVIAVIAALAGYFVGVRQRSSTAEIPATAAPAATPAAPAAAPATPATPPAVEARVGTDAFGDEKARLIRSRDSEAAALRRELADREPAIDRLATFTRERAELFRTLADTRAETARYRQLVIDIETNAPPPILAGLGEPDDLKLIVGIGPVLERMLHGFGVMTFRQIARWTDREVAEFDAKLPEFPGRIVRDQWVTQARALHQSKYGTRL